MRSPAVSSPAPPRRAQLLALLVPAALLGGAYISQYGFGLYPCEMCWWQRYPHLAAILLAIASLLLRGRAARALLIFAALAIFCSGLIGAYHAGVEYAWWQGVTTCAVPGSSGGGLEAILNAPLIRCDVAPWSLFGISLAGWNFLISTAAFVAILLLARRTA